jgi:tetratricopeptide (TPR) repeat protein
VANKALQLVSDLSMLSAQANLVLMKAYVRNNPLPLCAPPHPPARRYFKLKQHTPSGKCYNAAKRACDWAVGDMHPFWVELVASLADLFYEEKDYESAALYLEKALSSGKKSLGIRHSLVAMLQSKTGILFANRGDSKKATVLLQTALEYFEKFSEIDDMVASAASM